MISPERLRSHPIFGGLSDAQLKAIAMISDLVEVSPNHIIIEENQPGANLYWLLSGSVELFFRVEDYTHPNNRQDFTSGWIDPGDFFGLSALVEPHCYTSSARTTTASSLVQIDAVALRQLCSQDAALGYELYKRVAVITLERLKSTRVQLAAAWK